MNKYIEELVAEIYFEICDLSYGQTYKDIGYDNKKDFYAEMKIKLEELQTRLERNPRQQLQTRSKSFLKAKTPAS